MRYGAPADDFKAATGGPFLGAIAWSRFRAAERLLHHGANPNAKTEKGETAFHLMLKKGSDFEAFLRLAKLGVRADIAGPGGVTAATIMSRKKDERFRKLAAKLGQA